MTIVVIRTITYVVALSISEFGLSIYKLSPNAIAPLIIPEIATKAI